MSFDSLVNRGDYFSAHYLAEVLPKDLRKTLLPRWAEEEKTGRATPRKGLRGLGRPYFANRPYFADIDTRRREGDTPSPDEREEWRKELGELHGDVLRALGYTPEPRELPVERAGKVYGVRVACADRHLVAVECAWASDVDAALDGEALYPVALDNRESISSAVKLASWLLACDDPPRYVLLLAGGVVVLADRAAWGEGRYLAVSLDVALGRNNPEELQTIAALFGADSLLPPREGGSEPLADLLANSRNHAVGVSKELRDGLKDSVELIANEVLNRLREQGVQPEQIMEPAALARELGREALRYLYRILFLLYAEARPELGILPTDDEDYVQGYGLARLGDLVVRDLPGEEARNSFHLYESLDLLFTMVNRGHPPRGVEIPPGAEGLRFEALRSDLFEPEKTRLIGRVPLDEDDPGAPVLDTRLRNATLHRVLRKLMLTKGRRKERGGFISYAQLGINQLGAVYEGLMSYSGFIATEDLYEVAKGGDPRDGSWMIPASKVDEYPSEVVVRRVDDDGHRLEEYVRYPKGSFVYRLAGRDRETSASYYTPESLTKVTVQLALRHRLDQDGTVTPAREILGWKICEPALGSGAFLNEAINQVAAEYLKRREKELGEEIDPERREEELQKVKAYIALHNSYGVDLNETAVELAEVSLWLNVMHPGLQAPWFGLHLRRGNSLIGAGRRVYGAAQLTKGTWLKEAPEDLPFSAGELPAGKVHHFLVPAEGWGAVAGAKEAKELAPEEAKRLAAWRKGMRAKVSEKRRQGHRLTQIQRLQALARRAEYLWHLVVQRLTISEREISRKIDVWGADWIEQPENAVAREKVYADLTAPDTPYWRLKTVMDAWCALWFWPLDQVGLLDGTDEIYARLDKASDYGSEALSPAAPVAEAAPASLPPAREPVGFAVRKQGALFGVDGEQLGLDDLIEEAEKTPAPVTRRAPTRKRPAFAPLRTVIPLANLDDWLDFAEALIGRADVPEDTLVKHFETLTELGKYEEELWKWMGMEPAHRLGERFPWLDTAEEIAEQQGFFHWELHFAQVFRSGGFDLQVGNPPWVRPTWQEDAVLAEVEPWFKLADKPSVSEWRERKNGVLSSKKNRSYYLNDLLANVGVTEVLGSGVLYPLLLGTQPDFYRAFMCRVWNNIGSKGSAGLIHPDTHFGGIKEGRLRASAYRHLRIHAKFINAANWAFEDLSRTQEFGLHIYGNSGPIEFVHFSDLYGIDVVPLSLEHDGSGPLPGIKYKGKWDVRPHRGRVIHVNEAVLAEWRRLISGQDVPLEQTPLLYPVSTAEMGAIEALANYGRRLGGSRLMISSGYHEKMAKEAGVIRWSFRQPDSWDQVILQGPHISVATPFAKQPPKFKSSDQLQDLTVLPVDAVPAINYERACDEKSYLVNQDRWNAPDGDTRRYTEFYRLAWRVMIPFNGERSLFAALVPPGPAHVHTVHSLALSNNRNTTLVAGFWATLPLDYMLRITGRSHLQYAEANAMPAADPDHPLASSLLLRTLRLNCLTNAYAPLWGELYDPAWQHENWAVGWPGIKPLGDAAALTSEWGRATPLRTERERRAALVELDALVALWLGMTADQLVAIYRSRYPVLSDYESQMWFDANGRKIAANHNTYGHGQTKEHYKQLMAHLDPEVNGPVPDGYTAPFYKADREAEYRQAHAVFSERLRRSGWQPPGGTQ